MTTQKTDEMLAMLRATPDVDFHEVADEIERLDQEVLRLNHLLNDTRRILTERAEAAEAEVVRLRAQMQTAISNWIDDLDKAIQRIDLV